MKRLILIFFTFCSFIVHAQQYNNEWIDYSKTYYKFKVGSTGLYRIPQSSLAGIGLSNTDASYFQLWRNGAEIPVYTSSQTGALASGGYIEFWGEKNDGIPDNQLYRNTNDQLNNTASLFTDTAAYFLTVNPAGGNKRLLLTPNIIPTGAMPEPFFIYTKLTPFNETLHLGRPEGTGTGTLYTASYEQGKGWTSNDITNGQTRAYTENLYAYNGSGAPNLTIKMNAVGNANVVRNIGFSINGNSVFNSQLLQYNYASFQSTTMPASTFNGNVENFAITNTATTSDRIRVALIEITYPRFFNFGGANNFRFKIAANTTGKYLEITGFNFSGTPVLYDLSNGRYYDVDASNASLLKVFLQPSAVDQDLVLVSRDAATIKNISQLETRNFVNYLLPANQGDYLMVTHNNILNGSNGSQPVEEYRAYRSSVAGGGYNAKVYMIDQLIDQFAFGIKNNPLSVRNFSRWARNKFSLAPKHIFIAAKGVTYNIARLNELIYPIELAKLNLVPTMGNPGSDVLLTSEGNSSIAHTSIGRLSIVNGDELSIYLNKVKQYESGLNNTSPSISESAWKKNVIHMVGANDQPTIDLLYFLLNNHKGIIRDTLYGAKVTDFVRSYSSSEQQLTSERLADLMNSGVGLLTYFGHSSATSLGFNLDDPMNYTNSGKYPLFNMMGCDVGNIFGFTSARISSPDVLSEKYVLAKDRGSIGMLAGTSIGYVNTLDFYNLRLYRNLATTYYAKTIGELMKSAIETVFSVVGEQGQLQRSQCEEYTLNGDPAIRLYQLAKPDYAIEDNLLNIVPNFISIAESNFTVDAKMMNLGKAINQKVIVELKRTYPNLTTAVIRRDTIPGIRFIDSLKYNIPIDPVKDKGLNKITVTIDPVNAIEELYENNNSITKDIFIFEDELRPVFPYSYAIINKQGIKFSASTANPLAPSRNYLFEIDTTELFNSPLKISQTKTSTGGLLEFSPSITFRDSTVYYWRVASAPAANEQPKWNPSSFIYINGPEVGFNQSHYYQKADNNYYQMKLDSVSRSLSFNKRLSSLIVRSGVWATGISQEAQLTVEANDQVFAASACGFNIIFNILDGKSFQPWQNIPQPNGMGLYNSNPSFCAPSRYPNFEFTNNPEGRNRAYLFLKQLPVGTYVVMRPLFNGTVYNQIAQDWKNDQATYGIGNTLYDELVEQGLNTIDSLNKNMALIFFYKKDQKEEYVPKILFGQGPSDAIVLSTTAPSYLDSGIVVSQTFGPAKQWKTFKYDGFSLENAVTDNVYFDIIGITTDGTETVVKQGYQMSSKEYDISSISAAQYPYLKLIMRCTDKTNFTPYQLDYWRLYYSPVPEGAIAPNIYFAYKDTLDVGEPLNLGVAFKNVSEYNFSDSLKVKITVHDKNNNENIINVPRQKILIANDTIKLNVPIITKNFVGNNSLFLEFNPDQDQLEQYHFNNFLYNNFYVRGDSVNPFLDVTFDGVHILNRDIVSSKPDILIKLTDEVKWMLLNSTDLIKVQLKAPDGTTRDFNFDNDTLRFNAPTSGTDNAATVNFKPHLLADGNYDLIIIAKDQSGNTAGDMQYRVSFQVINKPMISNLLNYPNPFTTSTAFVFTLTGSEIPQNIRIQILTITGKIVKEITKNELGNLKIGRNITEYKWDGTDQYGQKLANGVYLYRVITNLNGKQLEKYTAPGDNTDRYFNKGYGKMYLMR